MPKFFDPRDFFPHLKQFMPQDDAPKIPMDMDGLAAEQLKAQNPAYWMQMGQLATNNSASMPWVWYGMMLGTMEAMSDSAGNTKEAKKRHKKAVKAVRKFTKHVAGADAVKPPKVAKDAAKNTRKALKKAKKNSQKAAGQMSKAVKKAGEAAVELANSLSAPRGGMADDLKMISGIGPKLEETLNKLGIFHFDQISRWSQKDIEGVDESLRFSGRILRENWIRQADALARGGVDEYMKIFGKEPR